MRGEIVTETRDQAGRTVVVEARRGWGQLGVSEVWDHRELLYFFIWRDLKVRYKQTFFGALWAVIQPLLFMVVFTVSIGRLPGVGSDQIPYPVFVFAGMVLWTLFTQGLTGAANSLVTSESIITKVYFPRLLLPFAGAGSFLLDLCVGLVVLGLLMLIFGVAPAPTIILVPIFVAIAFAATVGAGTFLAAVNVRYRDVRYVVPFIVQIGLFVTPVVYSIDLIPEQWRGLYSLNPMVGAVEGLRWAIFGGTFPAQSVVISAASCLVVLIVALMYFRRTERTFADMI